MGSSSLYRALPVRVGPRPFAPPAILAASGTLLLAWSMSPATGIAGTAVIALVGTARAALRRADRQCGAILREELTTPPTRQPRAEG